MEPGPTRTGSAMSGPITPSRTARIHRRQAVRRSRRGYSNSSRLSRLPNLGLRDLPGLRRWGKITIAPGARMISDLLPCLFCIEAAAERVLVTLLKVKRQLLHDFSLLCVGDPEKVRDLL